MTKIRSITKLDKTVLCLFICVSYEYSPAAVVVANDVPGRDWDVETGRADQFNTLGGLPGLRESRPPRSSLHGPTDSVKPRLQRVNWPDLVDPVIIIIIYYATKAAQ